MLGGKEEEIKQSIKNLRFIALKSLKKKKKIFLIQIKSDHI